MSEIRCTSVITLISNKGDIVGNAGDIVGNEGDIVGNNPLGIFGCFDVRVTSDSDVGFWLDFG